MRESGYYPPGTEFDPRAPWNQEPCECEECEELDECSGECPCCQPEEVEPDPDDAREQQREMEREEPY